MSIEAEVFEQAKKRARRNGFLFAFFLVIFGLILLAIVNSFFEYEKKSPHIARIKIEGPIFDDFRLNSLIYDLGKDPNVKGVILHINSPGGSVVGAESTFVALSQLSEEKPSVAVLGETATSGGYLIAVATDKIISRSNTLTGSIGVILQYPNLSKFLKNIGIDINTLRSSDLKASNEETAEPTQQQLMIIIPIIAVKCLGHR